MSAKKHRRRRAALDLNAQRKGWSLWNLLQKHAPNFGGEEYWWEAEYRHTDGRTAFGTGRTRLKALQRAQQMFEPRPVLSPEDADPDMPF